MKHLALAALQWTTLIILRLALILLGIPIVALAIPFRRAAVSASGGREIVNLPRWAWLWGNDFDGLLGDKRGWWADNTPFGVAVDSYLAMWWWAAVRNPVNNLRFVPGITCPVSDCTVEYRGNYVVEDKPGQGGFQFVIARKQSSIWYGLYWVHEWSATRAFVVRLGYKIKPSHALNPDEPPKGMTFKVNPWKGI